MYHHKLGVYHLMIVSKYFDTIEDHINLELATPKAEGNMSKFHFNPIPLDSWSRQFFTSLETLHIYSKEDCTFEKEEFFKKVIWYEVDYFNEYSKKKKDNEIYKNVTLYEDDDYVLDEIPEGVTRISSSGCQFRPDLKELIIPESVTSIDGMDFEFGLDNLTAMTIPTYWERIGKRFYNNKPCFSSFTIPRNVKTINGKEINLSEVTEVKEFEIPSHVTRLDDGCFTEMKLVQSLIIPTSVVEIGDNCFISMTSLKSIEIPTSVTKFGDSLFKDCYSLTSVTLHDNYTEVKYRDFWYCTSLSSIQLPSTVTEIGDYSFFDCESLTSINLENVKEYKEFCFYNSGITKEMYPHVPDECFKSLHRYD